MEQPPRPAGVDNWITLEEAQARGLCLVCTNPAKGIVVEVGNIVIDADTGKWLRVVEVLNDRQALARLLRPRRSMRRRASGVAPVLGHDRSNTLH